MVPWYLKILTPTVNALKLSPTSENEIKDMVHNMKDMTPGPVGMTTNFYKVHWPTLKDDITKLVNNFLANRQSIKHFNSTF